MKAKAEEKGPNEDRSHHELCLAVMEEIFDLQNQEERRHGDDPREDAEELNGYRFLL